MLRQFSSGPVGGVLFLMCLAAVRPAVAENRDPTTWGRIKGLSWGWVGARGEYASPAAVESMKKLADTGSEWVCIAFSTSMTAPENPDFHWGADYPAMATDDEIRRAIDLARQNDLKVILKPVVNVEDGTWRAWIKFYRPVSDQERAAGITGELDPWGGEVVLREGEVQDLEKWGRWWDNYTRFLTHYAKIAREKNVEILCLGCEMNSTEEFAGRWRSLIAKVRQVYDGCVTYDVNHGREDQLVWWDAVDLISISAYYQIMPRDGRSIEAAVKETTPKAEIVDELERVKTRLVQISEKWHKPILFIETGVTSVRGCARYPWTHPGAQPDSPFDEDEQAHYYEAFFEVFWDEPWFMGFTWWDWPAQLYNLEAAAGNRGFCIYGKKAEAIVRSWYAQPSPALR